MPTSISDESAQRLREIMARQDKELSLDEAREFGEWLLDLYRLLGNE
ncbi:MAG TPA: hypothetical protein VLF87_02565 [Patescibacteria group bacterium]|nr:hypothetical protein [Patescibacteria group bacterium]